MLASLEIQRGQSSEKKNNIFVADNAVTEECLTKDKSSIVPECLHCKVNTTENSISFHCLGEISGRYLTHVWVYLVTRRV